MQNCFTAFWILILIHIIGHDLSGQVVERPPCGQEFFEQTIEISSPHWPAKKKPPPSLQRSQLIVPVVIHVVWHTYAENISDELIATQLASLNRDFNAGNQDIDQVPNEFQNRIASVGILFCLASKTPSGQPTNGVVRIETSVEDIGVKDSLFFDSTGGSNAWDSEKYLNIWVASTGTFLSGYGTYPGLTVPEKTGVVINPKYFGINEHSKYGLGRTLVHEVGHYLGLNHVWSNDPFCEDDDGIEDTPKQDYAHTGCPTHPQASCTESDMFMNFMDYVDDPCMLLFTEGQKEKIWTTIEIFRPTLLSNNVSYYCLESSPKRDLAFVISPNPLVDLMTITFPEQDIGLVDVQVFDMLGRVRKQKRILANLQLDMDMVDLEPGVYLVKIGMSAQILVKA